MENGRKRLFEEQSKNVSGPCHHSRMTRDSRLSFSRLLDRKKEKMKENDERVWADGWNINETDNGDHAIYWSSVQLVRHKNV